MNVFGEESENELELSRFLWYDVPSRMQHNLRSVIARCQLQIPLAWHKHIYRT